MSPIRARVRAGRLVVDEPSDLPEGTVLDLVLDDEADDLEPAERERLERALEQGVRDAAEGRTLPADEVIGRLRDRD